MTPPRVSLRALATAPPQADAYLIDLDGTLISGGRLLPHAVSLLAALPGPYCLVSNDSEHGPAEIASIFAAAGVEIDQARIVLAGAAAVAAVALRSPGARVMLLGGATLRQMALDLGLWLDDLHPELVLMARDRTFSFAKLQAAANAVRRGAELILACPDMTHPGQGGEIVPEVGALAAALFACVGDVPHEVFGKPEPTLFKIAVERLGFDARQCLMIGDNPLTDGRGAARLGIRFCEVDAVGGDSILAI